MKRQTSSLPKKDLRSVMAQAGSALTIMPEHHFDKQPAQTRKPHDANGDENSDIPRHPDSDNQPENSDSTIFD